MKAAKGGDEVMERSSSKTREPPQFKVVMHNDDYTPMDFVVDVLVAIFRKDFEEAMKIMLTVHEVGKGIAGVYSFEIAETKVMQAHAEARRCNHPFTLTIEEA